MTDATPRRPWQFRLSTLMLVCTLVGLAAIILVQRSREQEFQQHVESARANERLEQTRAWSADIARLFVRFVVERDFRSALALVTPEKSGDEIPSPDTLQTHFQQWMLTHGYEERSIVDTRICPGVGAKRATSHDIFFELYLDEKHRDRERIYRERIYCYVVTQFSLTDDDRTLPQQFGSCWRVVDAFLSSPDDNAQPWGTSMFSGKLRTATAKENE